MSKKLKRRDPATVPAGEYADDLVRILHLYVSPIGTRTWRVRLRPKGERAKRLTLGYFPKMTHEEARDAARIAHGAFRDRADPKVALEARQPRTVGQAIDEFLKSPMAVRKSRAVSDVYRKMMAANLRPPKRKTTKDHLAAIRGMEIGAVRRRDIARLKDTAPLDLLRKLRVVFSWAQQREYIEYSPFAGIALDQSGKDTRALISNKEDGTIDWRELVAVLRGIEQFAAEQPDNPWPNVYRLQLFTAMRPFEVLRLKWEDADLESEYPTLHVNGKTGRRQIPLARAAVKVLQQIQPDPAKRQGWIFPSGPRTPEGHLTAAPAAHDRIVELAGLKKSWNRKHLRKTVRTWFGAQRQDVLGRLALGHSLAGMDARYDGSDPLPLVRKGMNAFCDAVEAAMNPPVAPDTKVTPLRRAA